MNNTLSSMTTKELEAEIQAISLYIERAAGYGDDVSGYERTIRSLKIEIANRAELPNPPVTP